MQAADEWELPVIQKKWKNEYALHTHSSVKKLLQINSGEFGSVTNWAAAQISLWVVTVLYGDPSGPDRWAPWLISAVADMTSVLHSPTAFNIS